MLVFKDKNNHLPCFNIVFLCGSKFVPKSAKDKRVILKEFLISSDIQCQTVILEENFTFAKNKHGYLAYDDIFLSNLSKVECLAALYADKIIVIHETISTAAEIGMFASNPALTSKICILFPDDISIEEKKISSFINLAFFNNNDPRKGQPTKIKYYPDVEINRSSINKSDYHTYFHENTIGNHLGDKILKFVNNSSKLERIEFKKAFYGKTNLNKNFVGYFVSKKDKRIDAFIHTEALKIQLLSMFTVDVFRTDFRKAKLISEHVTYIEDNYKKILLNSIGNIEGIDSKDFSLSIHLVGTNECKLRQSIGFFLYMLQAIDFIGLEQLSDENDNRRKIRIKESLESFADGLMGYIFEKPETAFGGVML